jgi:hypothetical protein
MCKNKNRFFIENKTSTNQNLEKVHNRVNSENTKKMKQKFVQKSWVVFVNFVLNKKFILSRWYVKSCKVKYNFFMKMFQ